MAQRSGSRRRRGEGALDHLLVLTLGFLALIIAAYVWMPDFRRAVATLVTGSLETVGYEIPESP
jgi:hypothetical protein